MVFKPTMKGKYYHTCTPAARPFSFPLLCFFKFYATNKCGVLGKLEHKFLFLLNIVEENTLLRIPYQRIRKT